MDILIVYKWGYDPDDVFIKSDGTYKFVRNKLVASDDDAAAVLYARQAVEEAGGAMRGVTIGNGDASWVLARGGAETLSFENCSFSLDDARTAAILADAIKAAGDADYVVMGDARAFSGVHGVVAASLGLTLVAGVSDFAVDPDNHNALIAHRTNAESVETIRVNAPALVTVRATESEQNVPSMKQLLAARKLPVAKGDEGSIAVAEVEAVTVVSRRVPQARRARIFEGDAKTAVDSLVAALRADGAI